MVNNVNLVGNIGKKPELSYSQQGNPILKFSLATSEKWDGQVKTSWHNIVMFGKRAESLNQYLDRGAKVYVGGKIDYNHWTDKATGKPRTQTNIIADDLQMLGDGSQRTQTETPATPNTQTLKEQGYFEPITEDDIPF